MFHQYVLLFKPIKNMVTMKTFSLHIVDIWPLAAQVVLAHSTLIINIKL